MRNPNGYGSIVKMKGNRRNPYRVRITEGFTLDEYGKSHQIQRTLGSYATYEEAAEALVAYNRNPVSLEPGITFAELYRRWSAEKFAAKPLTERVYRAAFIAVESIHQHEFRQLKRNDLQHAVDISGKNYPTLVHIKLLYGQLYKYAVQNDLVEKDYSKFVDISKHKSNDDEQKGIHTDIKPEETAVLWERADDPNVQEALMLIYSGLRVGEFLALKPEDIDIDKRFITVRKSKTNAGRRRVPISSKTLAFWEGRVNHGPDPAGYLIHTGSKPSADPRYRAYKTRFEEVFSSADLPAHLPHDTRHTTASMLHAAGVEPYTVKKILGHTTQDVTESVYTHISDAALIEAIDRM